MIPESFIQELLHRVDIVDLIDKHVPLKKAGANYAACCPFHNEKTPSFTVSPTKQFYHCFGCGAHGTAIGFLMEYSGLGFVDVGALYGDGEKITGDALRYSTGIGFSWISPLGPLRFAFAVPLRKRPGDRIQRFQFQIGTSF